MPALPAMNTRKISLTFGVKRTQRVIGSYAEGVAYAIFAYENPQRQSLDEFIAESKVRRSRNREWTQPIDVKVNDFSGKQLAFTERNVAGTTQFFRTNNHLYQFEAVGASIADPRTQQFFSSLMLGKKLEGTQVEDGIGAQPVEDPAVQSAANSQQGCRPKGSCADQARAFLHGVSPSSKSDGSSRFESGFRIDRRHYKYSGGIRPS